MPTGPFLMLLDVYNWEVSMDGVGFDSHRVPASQLKWLERVLTISSLIHTPGILLLPYVWYVVLALKKLLRKIWKSQEPSGRLPYSLQERINESMIASRIRGAWRLGIERKMWLFYTLLNIYGCHSYVLKFYGVFYCGHSYLPWPLLYFFKQGLHLIFL